MPIGFSHSRKPSLHCIDSTLCHVDVPTNKPSTTTGAPPFPIFIPLSTGSIAQLTYSISASSSPSSAPASSGATGIIHSSLVNYSELEFAPSAPTWGVQPAPLKACYRKSDLFDELIYIGSRDPPYTGTAIRLTPIHDQPLIVTIPPLGIASLSHAIDHG